MDGVACMRYYGNVIALISFGKGRPDSMARKLQKLRPDREIIIVRDAQ